MAQMLERNKIYLGDSFKMLKELPDGCIDLIVTDPPYGMQYVSGHQSPNGEVKFGPIANDDRLDWFPDFFRESWRILKDDSYFYSFGNAAMLFEMAKLGVPEPDAVLVWDKQDYNQADLNFWSLSYELIFVWVKGRPKLRNYKKRPNGVMKCFKPQNFTYGSGDMRLHPTQKPVDLLIPLILYSSNAGDLVLDAFIGSGSTAIAALQLQRDFIGIEIDAGFVKTAEERIKKAREQRGFGLYGQAVEP